MKLEEISNKWMLLTWNLKLMSKKWRKGITKYTNNKFRLILYDKFHQRSPIINSVGSKFFVEILWNCSLFNQQCLLHKIKINSVEGTWVFRMPLFNIANYTFEVRYSTIDIATHWYAASSQLCCKVISIYCMTIFFDKSVLL